jgi:hypothetical protein
MKKKLVIAVPIILVVGYFLVVGILTFRAKGKYDAFASESVQPSIVELTPELEKEIQEALSEMEVRDTFDPDMQKEKRIVHASIGLGHDTQGFIDLMSFEPPPFHLFDMDKNRLNSQRMILKSILSSNFSGEVFVKKEENVITEAFIRMSDGAAYLQIKNDADGVYTESIHYTPTEEIEEVEPGRGGNGIRRATL